MKFILLIFFIISCSFLISISNAIKSKSKTRFASKLRTRFKSKSHSKLRYQRKLFSDVDKVLGMHENQEYHNMDNQEIENLKLHEEEHSLGIDDLAPSSDSDNFSNSNILENTDYPTPTKLELETQRDVQNLLDKQPIKRKRMKELGFNDEMNKINMNLNDWLSITSASFANTKRYNKFHGSYIHLNSNFTRINDKYINPFLTNGLPSATSFWFKQNLKYIYYFETKNSTNSLGTIYLDNVQDVRDDPKEYGCFSIIERDITIMYKICAETNYVKRKWLCKLQDIIKVELSAICKGKKSANVELDIDTFKIKHIIQPMILIPTPADNCNENWNYLRNGNDWECKCREGDNQSPIDLPPPKKAVSTVISPLFQYQIVPQKAENDSNKGLVKRGTNHRIYFRNGALRIYAESFGKVVTLDGAGYYADEIVFHTPSEHKINGKNLDMEMKIIHKAKTEGDFGKMLTLSFLFKKKAGTYNKFLDKLDFYNLPNPLETFQELKEDIFIPNIFLNEDAVGSGEMIPFNFYSYQGSVTEPPCNENTLVLVASEPLFLSYSTLELFKEALKKPDQLDLISQRIINTSENVQRNNARKVMPLKGRPVFHYDKKNECGEIIPKKGIKTREIGHYERVIKKMQTYFHVEGEKPSMMPGAYVVSDAEAKNHID